MAVVTLVICTLGQRHLVSITGVVCSYSSFAFWTRFPVPFSALSGGGRHLHEKENRTFSLFPGRGVKVCAISAIFCVPLFILFNLSSRQPNWRFVTCKLTSTIQSLWIRILLCVILCFVLIFRTPSRWSNVWFTDDVCRTTPKATGGECKCNFDVLDLFYSLIILRWVSCPVHDSINAIIALAGMPMSSLT